MLTCYSRTLGLISIFRPPAGVFNLLPTPGKPGLGLLLLLFFITRGFYGYSQLIPDFTVDITGGCSPINVAFTNLTVAGEGAVFLWDLGNGVISTARHPRSTYVQPGRYTVRLTVTYQGVEETIVRENLIEVYHSPNVLFSFPPDTIGCAPFSTTFQNLSTDPAGSPLAFTWSFGDGSRSHEINPAHVYPGGGRFNVTLMATNVHGCVGSYTHPGAITVVKPRASFGVDNHFSCDGALAANFANLSQARPGFSSTWDFGDGNTSGNRSPKHNYTRPGTFQVSLTVTDDLGCSHTVTRPNLINILRTTAGFDLSSDTICPGQEVRFTNTSRDATTFHWRFGDGSTATTRDAVKTYPVPGDYDVWLVARNGACADSIMKRVHVERVVAAFEVSIPFICQLPTTVNYLSRSVNAATYSWRFGNGTTSTNPAPAVTFDVGMPGQARHNINYSDTLTVTSRHGCTATYVKQNSVRIAMPMVLMDPGAGGNRAALNGCVPMNLVFRNRTVYNTVEDSIIDVRWRVGGGNFHAGESFPVQVTQPGLLPVELHVTTARGCRHAVAEFVNAGQSLPVDFDRVGSYQICASTPARFQVTSPPRPLVTREVWDFGDGSVPELQMPLHNYTRTGPMNVTLTVYNLGCPSRVTKNNIVNVMGPIARFVPEHDCNQPFSYRFRGTLTDATSWTWDFGDGSPQVHDVANPLHRFAATGNYTVRLTARNAATGCQYTYTRVIHVRDLESSFDISGDLFCRGNTLNLDGGASRDVAPFIHQGQTIRYLWRFHEENKVTGSMDAISHRFNHPGTNTISLVTRDANGCLDTTSKVITINHPRPDFQASHELGCMPVTFGFTDKTVSAQPIVNWNWDFGDGNTSSLQNPDHVYTRFGIFDISLEVTDAVGCKAKVTKNHHVRAIFPDASFLAESRKLCAGDTTRFFENSQSDIVSYRWQFGHGYESTLPSPRVNFPTGGHFGVSLSIVDSHGCEATEVIDRFIHVQDPPVADFAADVTESNCYPLVVQFFDRSITPYPGSWQWHFGENDNLSHLQNPFFIYNRPGRHDVTLVSRTSHGCADTIVKKGYINVGGPFATFSIPDTTCLNTRVTFEPANMINVHDARWDFGDGNFSFEHLANHSYSRPGTINPVLFIRSDEMDTCNKAIVDTLHVLDTRAMFTISGNTRSGCVPLQLSLSNQSLNANIFHWDFGNGQTSGEVNPSTRFEMPGIYSIKLVAKHPLGCKDSITVNNIVVHPLPVITVSRDTIICLGGSATLEASGAVTYEWTPAWYVNNPFQSRVTATPSETTWFVARGTDHNGCVNYNGKLVTVQQRPTVNLLDTTLIIGESLRVDISDNSIATYTWYPATNISCTNCPNPLFTAMESTNYMVAVTDTSYCFTVSYPFNLTVRKIYSVDVPSAFSPNGDGINDVVRVKGWGIKELIIFRVFNRFGQVVFESNDINRGWDGTFNGKPQPVETYTYTVEVKTHEETVLGKRGTIMLLR